MRGYIFSLKGIQNRTTNLLTLSDNYHVNYIGQFYLLPTGNNELDAGFINLMRMFNKVLGVQFDPEPAPNSTLDQKKNWLKESFKLMFKALNPNKGYSIDLDMGRVKIDNAEISGIITVTVQDQNDNMLYAFDFRSDPDQHGQLQDYKVNERLDADSYAKKLLNFEFEGKESEKVIWLLNKNADVKQRKAQSAPIFYQLFREGVSDNNGKIRFLEKINQLYDPHNGLFLTHEFKGMMKNVISDLDLNDGETLDNAAWVLMQLSKKEELGTVIDDFLKTTKIYGRFAFTPLNDDLIRVLCRILDLKNTSLTSLNLEENKISYEGAKALAEALKGNSSITSLTLKNNKIDAGGVKALAEGLKGNSSITSLNLANNNFNVEEVKALAEGLKGNSSITSLNLSENNIGDEGAKALAEALKGNTSITTLDLMRNKIGDVGAMALAEALKGNSSITSLGLWNNNIGSQGAKALAEALKGNSSLTSLYLSGNKIGDGVAKALKEAWTQGKRDPNKLTLTL